MRAALDYRRKNPDNLHVPEIGMLTYNDSTAHKNVVFADVLEVIESVILF